MELGADVRAGNDGAHARDDRLRATRIRLLVLGAGETEEGAKGDISGDVNGEVWCESCRDGWNPTTDAGPSSNRGPAG
jgi:hypothetical protein